MHNVVIDVEYQLITPRITDGIYGSGDISPQIGVNIIDSYNNQPFKEYPYEGYIDYCSKRYRTLRFEEKTYSFLNYTYPVPIKTINQAFHIDSYNSIFNFIVNNVMTRYERIDYIKNKQLSEKTIYILVDRVLSNIRLFNDFCAKTTINRNYPYIDSYIINIIEGTHTYIEATKI